MKTKFKMPPQFLPLSILGLALLSSPLQTLRAEDKAGYRITVQKTTLTKDDVRGDDYYNDKIDRTLGLKVNIMNVDLKERPESQVDYTIIVSRWGYNPPRYEKYQGSEKLEVLKQQQSVDLTLGKARIGGYANYGNKRYQDKVEAWRVAVKTAGKEMAAFTSGSNYERLDAKSVKPTP